ncbi:hypothetical protein CRE_15695 [Caenorhabditis remanei]|uniref:G-protein coupled receptors family 1 profile domain-containing protein n=1 Tax=Caenorhabditis remanei TaxID=31234 RepID=E3N887_CAERE|nr:hypothetical protein CRE_15695 [Caenorhabditis remanei]
MVVIHDGYFTDVEGCIKENWFQIDSLLAKQILCRFSLPFNKLAIFTLYNNCVHLSAICILINLFHIYILTRKALRTTSPIYILLTAIAMIDIVSLSYDIHTEIVEVYKVFKVCYSKETDYTIILLNNIMEFIRNYSRRCSTWLSFSIALIRTLIVKYPLNPKLEILSKPKIAFYIIPTILILSAPIHFMDIYKYQIVFYDENFKCTQFPSYTTLYYGSILSDYYEQDDVWLWKLNRTIDAVISKFIPCILFPIVTYLLVIEIRLADERRKKLNQSSIAEKDSKNTTKLVLFLTLPFFLGELPIGLILLTKPIDKLREAIGFSLFTEGIEKFFSVVLSATTATHMIVCVFMSSQYRESALSFIRCGVKFKSQNS